MNLRKLILKEVLKIHPVSDKPLTKLLEKREKEDVSTKVDEGN